MVQRRAARFVLKRYPNTSSVTDMISQLGWESLQIRRSKTRLILMYKAPIISLLSSISASLYSPYPPWSQLPIPLSPNLSLHQLLLIPEHISAKGISSTPNMGILMADFPGHFSARPYITLRLPRHRVMEFASRIINSFAQRQEFMIRVAFIELVIRFFCFAIKSAVLPLILRVRRLII